MLKTSVPENLIKHCCRAKYYRDKDGNKKLMSVQQFSSPLFREHGYELSSRAVTPPRNFIPSKEEIAEGITSEEARGAYIIRAIRRAKCNAFDLIYCNPCLDHFVTMTISPESADRTSWDECYRLMKIWLSNRVTRHDLKYIMVPEYHHDGKSIHFHALMNGSALRLKRAINPSGNEIFHNGQAVWNLKDCKFGFSTVVAIGGEDAKEKVAKYIFKYMGKQLNLGARIGGRYFLHGGQLDTPVYEYGEIPDEFIGTNEPKFTKSYTVDGGLEYNEFYFV